MASGRRTGALATLAVAILIVAGMFVFASDDGPAPSGGILLGAAPGTRAGETRLEALQRLERQTGRRLAVVRVYKRWDGAFPDALDRRLAGNGQIPFLSLQPRFDRTPPGRSTSIRWRTIADAPRGGIVHRELVSWADRIAAYGRPLYFTFHHEPDNDTATFGTPADLVDAWRRVVSVFRERGATNARFAWTLTAFAFEHEGRAGSFYPGDAYVDVITADGYNFSTCRGTNTDWKTVDEVFASFLAFAAEHPTKGLAIAELGGVEDPDDPGRKAAWLGDARAAFTGLAWDRLEAVVYWNSTSEQHEGCAYWLDSSETALDAWRRMAADPAYAATAPPHSAASNR